MISAVFAAIAGGFQGHYVGLLSPTPMKFNEMAMIVIMVIVGGLRTFAGPILGAVFIELLFEWLRAWGEIRMVLFALLVIIVARAYPTGLAGLARTIATRSRHAHASRRAPLHSPPARAIEQRPVDERLRHFQRRVHSFREASSTSTPRPGPSRARMQPSA